MSLLFTLYLLEIVDANYLRSLLDLALAIEDVGIEVP